MCQIVETLFIIFDVFLEITRLCFDMFVYGDAFDYRPFQSGSLDEIFTFFDLLDAPYFSFGKLMQGGYDAGCSGLAYV